MSAPARFAALFLSLSFGLASLSVGIDAFVKSNNLENLVSKHVPPGVVVDINKQDVFATGIVVTIVSGLLAITSIVTLLFTSLRTCKLSTTAHRVLASLHVLFSTCLFAALVPFDDIARNRQVKITASLGGIPLPPIAVQQQEHALGVSPTYWSMHYIRLVAIIPWFAVLFGVLAGAALFRAPASMAYTHNGNFTEDGPHSMVLGEKPNVVESASTIQERDEKV
ncbi:hypothetical protein EW145_g6068 [Phellinidium pouzarii]|uniref:Uncharacterized protein n=1 Tax=Phellinidium pouzarii TaxID=167371 RepID=A0A4S4KZ10_9AGAM|nr:hypothetical protein EW145_g6068 [Phellinidium pouzarii]